MSTFTNTDLSRLRRKRVVFNKSAVAKTTDAGIAGTGAYYMLVSRMNANGNWKHKAPGAVGGPKAGAGIVLYGARSYALPANLADRWDVCLAVILSFNSTTSANLAYLAPLPNEGLMEANFIDLTISGAGVGPVLANTGGALANQYATKVSTVTNVNTAGTLKDPQNNSVTPAVGDLIFGVFSASEQLATPAAAADNIAYFEAAVFYDLL